MIKRFLIAIPFIFWCISSSYSQENEQDNMKSSSTLVVEGGEDNPVPPSLNTPQKEEKKADNSPNEGGEDKNFGVVFDGASISLSAGMNVYFGDIAAYNLFPRPSQFNNYITSAFKASVARDIKWGLGAQFNYQKGSLIGTRKTGRNSSVKSFRNHFFDISLQVRYLLSDALFKKNKNGKLKLYTYVGFGSMWYRTQLYDTKTLGTKDFEGYIEVENTQGIAQKTLSDKTAKARTWVIPYGATLIYRYNYKMDIHLDFTQSSTFTDRLDAFDRDWTAKDKYNYIGIGITYNFNRSSADAPKKRVKKEKSAYNEDPSDNSSSIGKGIFGKKKKSKKAKDDELLNIRLKLFETQLKLFEMQYLLGK